MNDEDEKVKIHLKQQIDEAIEEAEQRFLIQQKDIGLYKTSVHMLSKMRANIDINMPKAERKDKSHSFSMFIIHMLEPADMEFSNHLASIHYEYKRLFDLIDPDVQKIIFDDDEDDDFDDDEDDDDDDDV